VTARARFKQADLVRAVNAFKAAGLTIARVEIDPNGTITIIPEPNGPGYTSPSGDDAWDQAIKEFSAARQAGQARRQRSKG
jgi:hypothetical protein